jgi:hypothetical protein
MQLSKMDCRINWKKSTSKTPMTCESNEEPNSGSSVGNAYFVAICCVIGATTGVASGASVLSPEMTPGDAKQALLWIAVIYGTTKPTNR